MSELWKEVSKRGRFRLLVRCCAAVIAVVLVLPILPWPWTPLVWPSLSPYVLVCSTVAARAAGVATLIGLPVLVIVLVRRRFFCRYLCPVGLLAAYTGRLRPGRKSMSRKLPPIGRWVALLTLGGAIFGYPLFLWMDPLAIFHGVFTLWHDPPGLAGQVSAVALGFVLSVSLLVPGAWCLRIVRWGRLRNCSPCRGGSYVAKG